MANIDGMTVDEMMQFLTHRANAARSKAVRYEEATTRLRRMTDDGMRDAIALGESQGVTVPYLGRTERVAAAKHEASVAQGWNEEAEGFASIAAALKALKEE